jgi:4-hydroxy-tetrahydrodipicolinate reductase
LFSEGKMGHAGFQESACLIAHAMGWHVDEISETCEPMIAPRNLCTDFFQVAVGVTCGLHQRCLLRSGNQIKIELDLKMYLGAEDPHDAITIDGDPPIDLVLRGGIAGDAATVAALVNIVPRLMRSSAGLLLISEIAVPAWSGSSNCVPQ